MKVMKFLRRTALAAAAGVVIQAAALAGPQYVDRDGHALSGFDAVAYHVEGVAREGDASISAEHNGVVWLFSSAENRDLFLEDPERYAPAYDGHCAFAMANGRKVRADPEVWRIVDGRLYVNYSDRVQRRWEEDIPGYIAEAEAEYAEIEQDPPARPGRNH